MEYNFDELIDRSDSNTVKYDLRENYFGKSDIIPLWVADMDFASPKCVQEAIQLRAKHEIYGYSTKSESYFLSIKNWLRNRHNWEISTSSISFSPGVVPGVVLSIMAFTKPDDTIIVQTPVYFPFFISIEGNNRKMLILEDLIDICSANDIIIVSDEIHADLVFSPNKHLPIASISEKALNQLKLAIDNLNLENLLNN